MIERTSHLAWLCLYWVCHPGKTNRYISIECMQTKVWSFQMSSQIVSGCTCLANRHSYSESSMYADQRLPVRQSWWSRQRHSTAISILALEAERRTHIYPPHSFNCTQFICICVIYIVYVYNVHLCEVAKF